MQGSGKRAGVRIGDMGYGHDMPRAIWSGSISFGLVNAPVKMYSAIDEHDLELHLVHEKDGSRIGYEKVCKKEGKEVAADEIVKAYEVSDGDLFYLTEEDFKAAGEEGYRAIEVLDFVPHEEIDPIVFQRTYYLGPADGAEKVYALLVRAMEESGLSAVARYVFHDRLHDIVKRKRKGEEIHAAAPEEQEAPPDLLEALRASVDAAKSKSSSRASSKSRNGRSKRKPSRRPSRARA